MKMENDKAQKKIEDQELKIEHKQYENIFEDQRKKFIDQKNDQKGREQYFCHCQVCDQCCDRRIPISLKYKNWIGEQLIQPSKIEKDYCFIIKRLVPPPRISNTLKINVPETVCFVQGEPRFIVYTVKDKKTGIPQLKIIRQKEKLTLGSLRKQLNERRKKIKEQMDQKLMQEGKFQQEQTEKNSKEAVLCRYDDDNVQIMNEIEFLNLSMKRKTDPIWQKIQFIQNFIRPRYHEFKLIKIKFKRSKIQDQDKFERASIQSKVMNGDILQHSDEYISTENEDIYVNDLKRQDYRLFLEYKIYKMVHFIQIFHGQKITRAIFQWMLDDLGQYNLVNAQKVQYTEEKIFQMTNEIFNNQIEKNTQKILQKLTPEKETLYGNRINPISRIENVMQDHYKLQKKVVGMDLSYFDQVIDPRSDQAFSSLHPEAEHTFTEIMNDQSLYANYEKQFQKMKIKEPLPSSKMLNFFFYRKPLSKKQQQERISFYNNSQKSNRKKLLGISTNFQSISRNQQTISQFQTPNKKDPNRKANFTMSPTERRNNLKSEMTSRKKSWKFEQSQSPQSNFSKTSELRRNSLIYYLLK